MTTTQTKIRKYDTHIEIDFTTDFVDSDFDFAELTLLFATTNDTSISCDVCSADFTLATTFYSIDSSVAFCASHLPSELLDEITITL